jgi:hypothetical protein
MFNLPNGDPNPGQTQPLSFWSNIVTPTARAGIHTLRHSDVFLCEAFTPIEASDVGVGGECQASA